MNMHNNDWVQSLKMLDQLIINYTAVQQHCLTMSHQMTDAEASNQLRETAAHCDATIMSLQRLTNFLDGALVS